MEVPKRPTPPPGISAQAHIPADSEYFDDDVVRAIVGAITMNILAPAQRVYSESEVHLALAILHHQNMGLLEAKVEEGVEGAAEFQKEMEAVAATNRESMKQFVKWRRSQPDINR